MMRQYLIILVACMLSLHTVAQQYGSFKDPRDGKVYKTVKIGTQTWMAENLNVDRFRNGDLIPEAKTEEEWEAAGKNKKPAWCYYENNPANGIRYGKLYNWYAVRDPRGLAPPGYHVPSDTEWTKLEDNLGSDEGTKMKSKSGWNSYYSNATGGSKTGNGSNSSGFSGLPGGFRLYYGSFLSTIGDFGRWWSSSEESKNNAWYRQLYCSDVLLGSTGNDKQNGFSIRCLRD